jgi:hypothetical protein
LLKFNKVTAHSPQTQQEKKTSIFGPGAKKRENDQEAGKKQYKNRF